MREGSSWREEAGHREQRSTAGEGRRDTEASRHRNTAGKEVRQIRHRESYLGKDGTQKERWGGKRGLIVQSVKERVHSDKQQEGRCTEGQEGERGPGAQL